MSEASLEIEAVGPMIVEAANRELNLRMMLATERRRADEAIARATVAETELAALRVKSDKPKAVA